jgi:ATP-binding cassette subfamily B protein
VDPAGQLWEQSLYDNLTYGDADEPQRELPLALSRADLLDVLEKLPDGMQSNLGESGARVSGGQGQRVRLGRALMRRGARLVLLDEPFRGLERSRRRVLLERVRTHWPRATLLFVSHDIRETLEFDRVLVLDRGQLVEDGVPAVLAANASSRYAALLNADQALDVELWSSAHWRRLSIADGRVEEQVSQ